MTLIVLLFQLATLLLAATASANSLGDIIRSHVENFNNTALLTKELHVLLELSNEVLMSRDDASLELIRHLEFTHDDIELGDLLSVAQKSLGLLQEAAYETSIPAIVTRRVLLACIVLHWMREDEDAPQQYRRQDTELLSEVLEKMYLLHVRTAVRKGILDYMHISKNGGTSFRVAATKSGCAMAERHGQPLYLGDTARWLNGTAFKELTGGVHMEWTRYGNVERGGEAHGCLERSAWLAEQQYQYVGNEYTLFGGLTGMRNVHVCTQGVNMVTLREPTGHLLSHMHYVLSAMMLRMEQQRPDVGRKLFFETFCTSNQTVWEAVAPAILDNYQVRLFSGEKTFHAPYGAIGEEHQRLAQLLLLHFDLIMVLEAGSAEIDLIMHQGLGWDVSLSEVHVNSLSAHRDYHKEDCSNSEMLERVLPRLEPDRQFYWLGRVMSFLDVLMLDMAKQLGLKPRRRDGGLTKAELAQLKENCGLFGGSRLTGGSTLWR